MKHGLSWRPSAPLWYLDPYKHGFLWEQTRLEQPRFASAGANRLGASVATSTSAAATGAAPSDPDVWITSIVPMIEVFIKLSKPGV